MIVENIHRRTFDKPIRDLIVLFQTLASKEDRIWPHENWPPMRFKDGLKIGSAGGHGPVRYIVVDYKPKTSITFKFQKPKGFNGIHKLELVEHDTASTEVKHTIDMTTSIMGSIKWLIAIRWLHDALLEDALDKIENQLYQTNKKTKWNLWVKLLHGFLTKVL